MRAGLPSILLLLAAVGFPSPGRAAPAKPPASPYAAQWDSVRAFQGSRRWAAAESLATEVQARIEARAPVDSIELGKALVARAVSHWQLASGDGVAPGLLERAAGMLDRHAPVDDSWRAYAHLYSHVVCDALGRYDDAYRHARALVRLDSLAPKPDTLALAQHLVRVATAARGLGRYDEARARFEASIGLRQAVQGPDSPDLVPALAEYGQLLSDLGEFDDARAWLARARRLAERVGDPKSDLLEGVLARQTTLEDRTGNLAESIELAQRSYELARARVGPAGLPTLFAKVRLANRYAELGDEAASAAAMRELLPAYVKALGPRHPLVVNARLSLVHSAVAAGDTSGMRAELDSLGAIVATQRGIANSNGPYVEMLSAELQREAGDLRGARARLEAAVRGAWDRRAAYAARLSELLAVAVRTLRSPAEVADARRLLALADSLRDETAVRSTPEWLDFAAGRAAAEVRTGMREAAWRDARLASERSRERLRYQVQALSDRRSLQLAERLAAPCDVLAELARDGTPAEVRTAWDEIVRWRGLVRTEVENRRLAAAAAADTAVAGAHARWLFAQRRLAQLVVSGAAHPDDPASAALFASGRRDAEDAERRFMRLLGAAPPDSISLAHVLEHLPRGHALVAFVTADAGAGRRLGALVAAPGAAPVYVDLGEEAPIEAAVADWTRSLATPPPAARARAAAAERAARARGALVRARAWDPLRAALGGAHEVWLVPVGALWRVPWLALPAGTDRYLADADLTVHVLNAERELLPGAGPPRGRGLLAVGDPDFDHGSAGGAAAGLERGGPGRAPIWPCSAGRAEPLPRLPATRAEVEGIARAWDRTAIAGPAERLLGDAAGEAAFKREAPGHAVVHLATHGIVVRDTCEAAPVAALRGVGGLTEIGAKRAGAGRPAASPAAAAVRVSQKAEPWLGRRVWLALAGANRPVAEASDENEGLLTAEEVATLDLAGTGWVVLSACHSGEGEDWGNEGEAGMRRAFHMAGARAVIASGWAVADDATRDWMLALYAARGRGLDAGAAVRAADRATLDARRRDGRTTHPFYWAAFEATGE